MFGCDFRVTGSNGRTSINDWERGGLQERLLSVRTVPQPLREASLTHIFHSLHKSTIYNNLCSYIHIRACRGKMKLLSSETGMRKSTEISNLALGTRCTAEFSSIGQL